MNSSFAARGPTVVGIFSGGGEGGERFREGNKREMLQYASMIQEPVAATSEYDRCQLMQRT